MVNETSHEGTSTSFTESNTANNFDKQCKSELLTHVQLLLSSLGFNKSANLLINEIEEHALVPKRYNINGVPCKQTFDEYVKKFGRFGGNLIEMIKRLDELTSLSVPPVITNLPVRLFASKRQSINRKSDVLNKLPRTDQVICRRPTIFAMEKINQIKLLMARQFGGQVPFPRRIMLRKDQLEELKLHSRVLGHLGPIFCVKFDVSGRFIFTGADDSLVKIWDATTCLLRYTFRGHSGYIMDMAVSPENTILATASSDKTVRMWCLKRGKLLHVHKGHTAVINTLSFLPYMKNNVRYLVSAGNDCSVFFLRYEASNNFSNIPPLKFNERTKPGARLVSLCHSPGGNLVALGDTNQFIRVYQVFENSVERLFQISAHSARVDSLIWAHKALRFVSGSKDGTAKVWFVGERGWCSSTLKVPRTTLPNNLNKVNNGPLPVVNYQRLVPNGFGGFVMQMVSGHGNVHSQLQTKKNIYCVIMLCWTLDDDMVVSSGSDNLLRTWNWKTGEVLRILNGHSAESFVLLAHPIYREVVISVGHDAKLIVWNVYTGKKLKVHHNTELNGEKRAIFDMSISPDGTLVTFVDNFGHLSILGLSSNAAAAELPKEQFFNTDYRPIIMDDEGYILDELTGLAPHNMDPPIFVNSDGVPYREDLQRMVPGNDILQSSVEPFCPWVKRNIIPTLSDSEHSQIISEWENNFERELQQIDSLPNALQISPESRHLAERQRKPKAPKGDKVSERLAHIERMTNELMHRQPGVPRYVMPTEEDDSDNDPSYTAEDDESHRSINSVNTRSSAQFVDDEEEDELPDEWDSEYEFEQQPPPTYATSMRLRNGRHGGRIINDDEEYLATHHDSDGGQVRRSTRRVTRSARYISSSRDNTPAQETVQTTTNALLASENATTANSTTKKRGRKPLLKKENTRKTSQSSKENANNSNEDEPCCSKSLSNNCQNTPTSNTMLQTTEQNENGENELSSVDNDDDELFDQLETLETEARNSDSKALLTNQNVEHNEESPTEEEGHKSDDTYKNESNSSHDEDEEEEEREDSPSRPHRKIRRRDYYSPDMNEFIDEHLSTSYSSTPSPSSSSCYSSGKKNKSATTRRRGIANNGLKRKAVATRNENVNKRSAKRPRRAAANNARNRFRESSDFEDENATTRLLSADGTAEFNYDDIEQDNEDNQRVRTKVKRRISSSSDDVSNTLIEQNRNLRLSSSNRQLRKRVCSSPLRLPEKTRTGRRIRPNVRYCEDD